MTKDIPKVMIEVCGETIIKRALNNLAELNKIKEVIIIIGYKAEKVREHLGVSYKGMKITYVLNKDYASTNNIYSLWLARDHIKSDFILLEGDIIFEKEMLNPLLDSNLPSLALVGNYNGDIDGTVVTINENTKKIKSFIGKKDQGPSNSFFIDKYKTINIYLFTLKFFKTYFNPSLDSHINIHGKNDYYEVVLGALAHLGAEIYAHLIEDMDWYEIDNIDDLEHASLILQKEP